MDMVLGSRRAERLEDGPGPAADPARRRGRAMFFPLVVLAAVLPGLYALNWWNLTPPGPWWGLRGLAVLDGWVVDQSPAAETLRPAMEARAFRAVALQPPLYAWLEAVGPGAGVGPRPFGDGPAQLRRRGPDRPADLLARPALARARAWAWSRRS